MEESNNLTKNSYWNLQYKKYAKKSFVINTKINLATAELDKIFKKFLPYDRRFKFIEIGCAPGGWMYYFHKNFGFDVEGIEYTADGTILTKNNLKLLNIKAVIHEEDLFNNKLVKESYDVVFSTGFIEHFDDSSLAIEKHLELLKKNGYLILILPNLRGFNRIYQSICDKNLLQAHNLDMMNLDYFKVLASRFNLESLEVSYAGIISFGLFEGKKLFKYLGYMVQFLLNKIYFLFDKKIFIKNSSFLSPYIIALYIKK